MPRASSKSTIRYGQLLIAALLCCGHAARAQPEPRPALGVFADKHRPTSERIRDAMNFLGEEPSEATSGPPPLRTFERILNDPEDTPELRFLALSMAYWQSRNSNADTSLCDTVVARALAAQEEMALRRSAARTIGLFCIDSPTKTLSFLKAAQDPALIRLTLASIPDDGFTWGRTGVSLAALRALETARQALQQLDSTQLLRHKNLLLTALLEALKVEPAGSRQEVRVALIKTAQELEGTPELASMIIRILDLMEISESDLQALMEWLAKPGLSPEVAGALLHRIEPNKAPRQQLAPILSAIATAPNHPGWLRDKALGVLNNQIIRGHQDSAARQAVDLLRHLIQTDAPEYLLSTALLGLRIASPELVSLSQDDLTRVLTLLTDKSRSERVRGFATYVLERHVHQLSAIQLEACLALLSEPEFADAESGPKSLAMFLDRLQNQEGVREGFWGILRRPTPPPYGPLDNILAGLINEHLAENVDDIARFLKAHEYRDDARLAFIDTLKPSKALDFADILLDAYFSVASSAKANELKDRAREAFNELTREATNRHALWVIPVLEHLIEQADAMPSPPFDMTNAKAQLEALRTYQRQHPVEALTAFLSSHPRLLWIPAAYATLALLVFLALRFRPLWLLSINERLSALRIPIKFLGLPEIPIPVRYLLLVGFVHHHRRVFQAWVEHHRPTILSNFDALPLVAARSVCLAVPGLDGRNRPIELTPDLFDNDLAAPGRQCLLFMGEGGAGKTTLAVGVARRALERLGIVPLFIPDSDFKPDDGPERILEVTRGVLQSLTAETDLSPSFVKHMLRRGKVLVILDRLSERSDATGQTFNPAAPDFPIAKLLITSRGDQYPELAGRKRYTLERLRGAALTGFVQTSISAKGYAAEIPSPETHRLCFELEQLARERGSTPLLASLFIEWESRKRRRPLDAEMNAMSPHSIPNLFALYVSQVMPPATAMKWAHLDAARCIRVLARRCVQEFHSDKISMATALSVLKDACGPALGENLKEAEGNARGFLTCCLQELRLLELVGVANTELQFTLDPLAEYLGALQCIEELGRDEQKWAAELQRLQDVIEDRRRTSDVRGYVMALAQSVEAASRGIPEAVRQRIHDLSETSGLRRAA